MKEIVDKSILDLIKINPEILNYRLSHLSDIQTHYECWQIARRKRNITTFPPILINDIINESCRAFTD